MNEMIESKKLQNMSSPQDTEFDMTQTYKNIHNYKQIQNTNNVCFVTHIQRDHPEDLAVSSE